MSLTRRNVGQADGTRETRGSSIWEDEADEYWKKMEPAQRCRRITSYLGGLVAALLLCGGAFYGARTAFDAENLAALKARFAFPVTLENSTKTDNPVPIAAVPDSTPNPVPIATTPAPIATVEASGTEPIATTPAPIATAAAVVVDQEKLRGLCRVRGVQSRWHEETCRKLCVRDPHNAACMNGCSYGSLTVTKLVCDKMEATEVATASRCPDGVSCMEACRAYDDELPFPDLRNSCVRGCSNIVPSACARSLQIYRDLVQSEQ